MSQPAINEKFACTIGEYSTILKAATREGWLQPLLEAHLTPCSQDVAKRLLDSVFVDGQLRPLHVPVRWTNRRGRARKTRRGYGISLPATTGVGCGRLRVGLVLHEAAHILDRRESGTFGHQEKFRRILRRLVEDNWRKDNVRTGNQREIYARHRGPYSRLLSRAVPGKGGKVVEQTDHDAGPYSAEEAHEESRIQVNDTKDNITTIHVFSISEGQFTGAFYARGNKYPSWSEMLTVPDLDATEEKTDEGGLELPAERDEAALLSGGSEPLRQVDDPVEQRVPAKPVPARRPVRNVPPQEQAAAGAQRKRGALLELDPGNAERWPNSKGASIVRAAIEKAPDTASGLAKRLAADLAAAGVEFPASLISRLKQGGFLREVQS